MKKREKKSDAGDGAQSKAWGGNGKVEINARQQLNSERQSGQIGLCWWTAPTLEMGEMEKL